MGGFSSTVHSPSMDCQFGTGRSTAMHRQHHRFHFGIQDYLEGKTISYDDILITDLKNDSLRTLFTFE